MLRQPSKCRRSPLLAVQLLDDQPSLCSRALRAPASYNRQSLIKRPANQVTEGWSTTISGTGLYPPAPPCPLLLSIRTAGLVCS